MLLMLLLLLFPSFDVATPAAVKVVGAFVVIVFDVVALNLLLMSYA